MPNLLPPHFEIPASGGPIVVLTGAGISAESGVPTFRGSEGFWRVGSRNYQPTEMATALAFSAMPEEVWRWYLYRRGICRAAAPNAAHLALVRSRTAARRQVSAGHAERRRPASARRQLGGAHLPDSRQHRLLPLPQRVQPGGPSAARARWRRTGQRSVRSAKPSATLLRCDCGDWLRPHVLWFDESYDEPLYRYLSALRAAEQAAALVVVGTSGATTLPTRMCEIVAARGAPFIVVDPEQTVFSQLAEGSARGLFLRGAAAAVIPSLIRGADRADLSPSNLPRRAPGRRGEGRWCPTRVVREPQRRWRSPRCCTSWRRPSFSAGSPVPARRARGDAAAGADRGLVGGDQAAGATTSSASRAGEAVADPDAAPDPRPGGATERARTSPRTCGALRRAGAERQRARTVRAAQRAPDRSVVRCARRRRQAARRHDPGSWRSARTAPGPAARGPRRATARGACAPRPSGARTPRRMFVPGARTRSSSTTSATRETD